MGPKCSHAHLFLRVFDAVWYLRHGFYARWHPARRVTVIFDYSARQCLQRKVGIGMALPCNLHTTVHGYTVQAVAGMAYGAPCR